MRLDNFDLMNSTHKQFKSNAKAIQRGGILVFQNDESAYAEHSSEHVGVTKSLRYLERNFDKPITVTHLAVAAGLSWRGINKAFLLHVGIPPGKKLRLQRLEAAKEILSNSDLPLRRIPARVGYNSMNSFLVAFKNATGVSPRKFREQFRSAGKINGATTER